MAALGQLARQDDMTVEQRAHLIRHRIVHGVLFDQHCIDGRDHAFTGQAGTLHQTWQQTVDRRRQTTAPQGFTGSQADFTLGPGKTGQRVNQQQHPLALAPETFGQRSCRERGTRALHA